MERAKRLRWFLHGLLEHGCSAKEFEKLVEALKMVFASPEEQRRMFFEGENEPRSDAQT